MNPELWSYIAAALALVGLMAYAVLGGADFGGGVWDLFATHPRKVEQRDAIAHAMGPVWESNHVWLIFVIVVLFTCFPYAYAPLATALFVPFHLALIGIMLRGAAFVFRGYEQKSKSAEHHTTAWSWTFGIASVISPLLLGMVFGAMTSGGIRVSEKGAVTFAHPLPWLTPYAIGCGCLALSTCAYLAAVYLTVETSGALREDFRKRAIISGTTTAALAGAVVLLAQREAHWFFEQLLAGRAAPIVFIGMGLFIASAWAVFGRRYQLSRIFAAGEIVALLLGWGVAHQPYLVYPDLKLTDSAAPLATIKFMVVSLPFGMALLVPSLWLLLRIFKSEDAPSDPTLPKSSQT